LATLFSSILPVTGSPLVALLSVNSNISVLKAGMTVPQRAGWKPSFYKAGGKADPSPPFAIVSFRPLTAGDATGFGMTRAATGGEEPG
jgi:hypothetical protein